MSAIDELIDCFYDGYKKPNAKEDAYGAYYWDIAKKAQKEFEDMSEALNRARIVLNYEGLLGSPTWNEFRISALKSINKVLK